jgi:hypothetical protein
MAGENRVANERCVGIWEDCERCKQTGKTLWKCMKDARREQNKVYRMHDNRNGNTPIRAFEEGKIAKTGIRWR